MKKLSALNADDAVIKITQNKCFKEVYKDLKDYEKATGAKVNFEKTKGLWVGNWKNRTDDPFQDSLSEETSKIKWTNKNVMFVGIYVGNDRPDLQTFEEIVPKLKKRLNFWKPLKLPILAKSRVIELYHASKLFYASNFYPLPPNVIEEVSKAFIDYITFPQKGKPLISKKEMEKLKIDGGLKLINVTLKAQTPKVHWLMRLITDENLKIQLELFNSLIGIQKGQLTGQDIIFTENTYVKRILKTDNLFYREALDSITKLNRGKKYQDINNEFVFFNPIFTTATDQIHDETIKPFEGNKLLAEIKTYGELLAAQSTLKNPRLQAAIRRKIRSIDQESILQSTDSNIIYLTKGGIEYTFEPGNKSASQQIIYSELIQLQSTDHGYETKWVEKNEGGLPGCINWDKVWDSVHKQFYTEQMKSTIWEQIHLHFYTTYFYNKWHCSLNPCPLCNKIPEDIFHIIFDCRFTKVVWKRIERVLLKIIPIPITKSEKALGLQPRTKKETNATIIRNWVTFTIRHLIMQEEREAFHIKNYHLRSVQKFFLKVNHKTQEELKIKKSQFEFRGLSHKFEKIATINNAVAAISNGEYLWKDIM